MSFVYIIGAGASYGEKLVPQTGSTTTTGPSPPTPPMATGFFDGEFLRKVGYDPADAEKDFSHAFEYIRWLKQVGKTVPVGEGPWASMNLEEIFTSIELSREFHGSESGPGARYVLIRDSLTRYVWKMISLCTHKKYGAHSKRLVDPLPNDATVITFNYDLLLDQEQIVAGSQKRLDALDLRAQYRHFYQRVVQKQRLPYEQSLTGLFLKMHGSLNWFRCTNGTCPWSRDIRLDLDIEGCLRRAIGVHIGEESCGYCGSNTIPLIVPPLLHKPILEDSLIRAIWGLARQKLSDAAAVVLIGFSAQPSDFYASWLLRTTVGVRPDVDVIIVNPANDPKDDEYQEHRSRMKSIFPAQFGTSHLDSQFLKFEEIERVQNLLHTKGLIA